MANLVPIRDLDDGLLTRVRLQARDDALMLARKQTAQPVGYRAVTPTDFNNGVELAQLETPIMAAATYTPVFTSFQLTPEQVFILYGFAHISGDKLITKLRFHRGPNVTGIVSVLETYSESQDERGILIPPMTWTGRQKVQIDLFGLVDAGGGGQVFEFIGVLADVGNDVTIPGADDYGIGRIPGQV